MQVPGTNPPERPAPCAPAAGIPATPQRHLLSSLTIRDKCPSCVTVQTFEMFLALCVFQSRSFNHALIFVQKKVKLTFLPTLVLQVIVSEDDESSELAVQGMLEREVHSTAVTLLWDSWRQSPVTEAKTIHPLIPGGRSIGSAALSTMHPSLVSGQGLM